ncbi:hypothetical protein JCM14635_33100 [Megalodesulfovibrio paquesii]
MQLHRHEERGWIRIQPPEILGAPAPEQGLHLRWRFTIRLPQAAYHLLIQKSTFPYGSSLSSGAHFSRVQLAWKGPDSSLLVPGSAHAQGVPAF